MKISYRILLINFIIVAIVLGSAAFAFYSLMFNVLSTQQSKHIVNSTNSFVYEYRRAIDETDDNFISKYNEGFQGIFDKELLTKNIDFIIEVDQSNNILRENGKNFVSMPRKEFQMKSFLDSNPHIIVKEYIEKNTRYYYGFFVSNELLNGIAKIIGADVAVFLNNIPIEISNQSINQSHIHNLTSIYNQLSDKENFEVFYEDFQTGDVISSIYIPSSKFEKSNDLQFLVFTNLGEAAELRSNLVYILITIGFAGIIVSLILTFLFTDKIRKQIFQLSKATEITKSGNFKNRIDFHSKDELGDLTSAFNGMLSELEKNQKLKNEYSEFITLINQNPTLTEIAEASLRKIINTYEFSAGSIFLVQNDKETLVNYYGWDSETPFENRGELIKSVIKNKEQREIIFTENYPIVSSSSFDQLIKHLLIIPIIYNNKIIALLELASGDTITVEARDYLMKIKDQLAIGIANATAFEQLANLVGELKDLNYEYQSQNTQIREQNERLLELHNQLIEKASELEIEKEKAEESTKLKSQFLASMSHELRTPMNSILGLTELILEDQSTIGKSRERLEVVLNSGKRLLKLINDILDLSKIEAGKMTLYEESINLKNLLIEIKNAIQPLANAKGLMLNITNSIEADLNFKSDKVKIVQVLMNLLGNAVKFTEKGEVELRLEKENDKLKFIISDSGIGISAEDQKIIFDEFRQIDGTTTRRYNGTGLGLSICKKIADILKGQISVNSKLGIGTKFYFEIPISEINNSRDLNHSIVAIDKLIENRKNPVLVIDDDPSIRYTIGQYLNSKGYDVIFADNGATGIKKAIEVQPFAITLDIMMPQKDGWDILKELKENELTKDIPVIMITILGDKNAGYGLGAFEYFVKPISSEKLNFAFNKLEALANKPIENIVLVDDDENEFEKFKLDLKNESIRIHFIQDSELAYSKILELQPELVIIDLMMPKVDGITLSHKLKSHKETRHIPIILSTAKDLSEEQNLELRNIVETITVKSKGHPLDVLKVVRDRIRLQEITSLDELKLDDRLGEDSIVLEEEFIVEKIDGKSKDILIVDDDSDSLYTINEIVKACNFNTILAKSGKECLEKIEEKVPDLILLDIMMPEMDGFQTIKEIRKNSRFNGVPIYAVTAKAMLNDKDVIFRNGFDDYIPKPVNPAILAFKINKIFVREGTH